MLPNVMNIFGVNFKIESFCKENNKTRKENMIDVIKLYCIRNPEEIPPIVTITQDNKIYGFLSMDLFLKRKYKTPDSIPMPNSKIIGLVKNRSDAESKL
ncbi:hypothetical protein BL250_02345 [Erwinia sp. OLTSP20]|nr:hypothetical protein BK416_15140 [Erwinia sp. OLSSP12]PIJ79273.1 hypothetical protein BLD47_15445 [Erwinia sp. OLCASP19]PIJ80799.1 hypothetical protein BLD46_14605 [Erwinia sp. OLMTSP26]PIJ91803.1 hypothetical protein BL249_08310 [Erwinia sp. OLFS4]PIJ94621.1 hypothetical protein BL250_02345 [Erwinia sp. OLTSP20]